MAAPFPESVVKAAWDRAGGKCECNRTSHNHKTPHKKELRWGSRGSETELGWESHHVNSSGPAILSNCEILCMTCHKATQTYGK